MSILVCHFITSSVRHGHRPSIHATSPRPVHNHHPYPFTATTPVHSPIQDVQAEVRVCSCQVMKQRGLDEWTLARMYCLEAVLEPILKSEIHRCFCMVIRKKTKFSVSPLCLFADHLTCQAPNWHPWYPPRLVLLVLVWMCTKFNYQSTPSSGMLSWTTIRQVVIFLFSTTC